MIINNKAHKIINKFSSPNPNPNMKINKKENELNGYSVTWIQLLKYKLK